MTDEASTFNWSRRIKWNTEKYWITTGDNYNVNCGEHHIKTCCLLPCWRHPFGVPGLRFSKIRVPIRGPLRFTWLWRQCCHLMWPQDGNKKGSWYCKLSLVKSCAQNQVIPKEWQPVSRQQFLTLVVLTRYGQVCDQRQTPRIHRISRWQYSGMLHRVVLKELTDVSEELTASMNLMMMAETSCERSVSFYQTTRCNIPEDNRLHTRRRGNLKSYLIGHRPNSPLDLSLYVPLSCQLTSHLRSGLQYPSVVDVPVFRN
jgi:hypothetical protein